MLLNAIEIKNYRSLEHVTLEKLSQFNVLIGRNNAGKSSVFLALYIVTKIFSGFTPSNDVLIGLEHGKPLELTLTFTLQAHEREEILDGIYSLQQRTALLSSPFLRKVQFFFKGAVNNPMLIHLRETRMLAEDGLWASIQRLQGSEDIGNPEHKYTLIETAITNSLQRSQTADLFDLTRTQFTQIVSVHHNQILTTSWASGSILYSLYSYLRNYFSEIFFFNPFRHGTPLLMPSRVVCKE